MEMKIGPQKEREKKTEKEKGKKGNKTRESQGVVEFRSFGLV